MKKSPVFFTDFHATPSETLPQKLHRLMKRAGFENIDLRTGMPRSRFISVSSETLPICGRSMPRWSRTM